MSKGKLSQTTQGKERLSLCLYTHIMASRNNINAYWGEKAWEIWQNFKLRYHDVFITFNFITKVYNKTEWATIMTSQCWLKCIPMTNTIWFNGTFLMINWSMHRNIHNIIHALLFYLHNNQLFETFMAIPLEDTPFESCAFNFISSVGMHTPANFKQNSIW